VGGDGCGFRAVEFGWGLRALNGLKAVEYQEIERLA
jgi:hypothetical protein